jgi:endogenous inhibitor of DNA gyrase (YacG/DUF329 family)
MAEFSAVKCDECGTLKLETNHWLVSVTRPGFEGIIFQPAEACDSPRNPELLYQNHCGERCAHIRLSRYLEELKALFATTQESVTR